ncbi:MAG: flagellar protein FlgN [Gammaproteobacteria bacterium]|nr:flagellar protein FlgN [Gammaproteobacteria bacterium]
MHTPNREQNARAQRAARLKQQLAQHHQAQGQRQQQGAHSAQPNNAPAPAAANNPGNSVGLAPAHIAQQVLSTLIEDKNDLQAMVSVLKQERAVLEQRQHRALEQFAEQKIALAAKLEARHKARAALLPNSMANASDSQSWRASIEALEMQSAVTLLPSWNEVEALLRESRELLQINEKIVGNLQNNVNRFINALRGETASGQTYTAAGKAESYSSKQPIISA